MWKLAVGASSKTIHLRLAIAAADEELVFCWQIVLLRHFVLFTHTSSQSPGTRRGREAACSTGTGGRNQIPAHDRVILVHNNKLPAAWCGVVWWWRVGDKLFPTNFNPFYATICYIWCCALEGKVRHTTTRTSTISRPQLVLRHTHSNRHTRAHTHALKDNWMLTHADAWNRAARHEKTLTLSHSGWFTGPRAYVVIRVQPFDKCIISRREITFLRSSHQPHVCTNVIRTSGRHSCQIRQQTDLDGAKGGAAGERVGGVGGLGGEQSLQAQIEEWNKHKRVWQAGLTILKPDLAFLKAGVRHQLPSFPFQRHEQSFLPKRWPVHQKQAEKEERKRKQEEENTCSRAGGG